MFRVDPGLCAQCVHRRDIATKTSVFVLCERSRTDPAFPRYPRLPVLACRGLERRGDTDADPNQRAKP